MPDDASSSLALPQGVTARVLLTSVFGPYAQDDHFGSRLINPMELHHNQVTRVQHTFSFRSFHRTWGLMLIQVNLKTPCTLLDFPSEQRFVEELKTHRYDVIGIGSIMTNLLKVRRMSKLIRKYQPQATIVVGGHIANIADLKRWVDADHIVLGDGIRWMRTFLGEDEDQPIRHPRVMANLNNRLMGVSLPHHHGIDNATLIPTVGCPKGCNFCSTSAMFGGKGKSIQFYRTGDELFEIMCDLESSLGVRGFFVMDENFLIDKGRALRLLELMEEHGKSWFMHVFSSADILQRYTMKQLVELGVTWVWIGLEGENSRYRKLAGTDTRQLVRSLQSHGIRVLGSSIIGLEDHSRDNIDDVIDYAVSHDCDLHQFMLYTPIPGTPLHAEHTANSTMLSYVELSLPDTHGQFKFNFRHPHIKNNEESDFLLRAFHRDFEKNGPSVVRMIRTLLQGWQRYQDHPNPRIRARFAYEASNLPVKYAGALWAARRRYRDDPHRRQLISQILDNLLAEFGWKSRLAAPIVGRYLYRALCTEEQRLSEGQTYEPPTFYETNSSNGPRDAVLVSGIETSIRPPVAESERDATTDSVVKEAAVAVKR